MSKLQINAGGRKPFNLRLLLALILGTLLSCLIYFSLITVNEIIMRITTVGYMVAAAIIIIIYFIYNKALIAEKINPDMLPANMSAVDKCAYFEKAKERKENSKWLIMILFMLVVPVALDLVKLFVLDNFFPTLSETWFS